MAKKRCIDGACEVNEDSSIVEKKEAGQKRFSFPKFGISILAKSLEEAEKKIKALTGGDYENKSI